MSASTEKCDKHEQENDGHEEESKDSVDQKRILPGIGRLSLNVKAVPYVPKQDGGTLAANEGSQMTSRNEIGAETGEQLAGNHSAMELLNGQEGEEELRAQVISLKKSLKQYEDMIGQYQASEKTRKREVDSALISAREVVERERREKLDVLSDRKSRQEQLEQLSKAMSLLQTENEELLKVKRQQEEKLQELARLKTLIQENGFPNIEQFLLLQRQNDTLREDFFTERKERERLQSQRDKIKRELEAAQSRIASLQEQVYKYREHIYFIQNKFKQTSSFRQLPFNDNVSSRPISASEACKLYGPNATQYINHSLTSPINPVSPSLVPGDPKFSTRNDKKPFTGGRQWQQDNRMPRPLTAGDDWRRSQQQSNRGTNGYYNNVHRMTSSNSAPSLAAMTPGADQPSDVGFYDKQYGKPAFLRRPRSSLTEGAGKDYGIPLSDWSKQNKQGKRFSSPLPSPTLLPSPGQELWSPQQSAGFQKSWPDGQDEIFQFPPSPLAAPNSKSSFDTWSSPSTLLSDEKVFSPQIPCNSPGENSLFPLPIPTTVNSSNGEVFVCFNCGINFNDNESRRSHVESCGL